MRNWKQSSFIFITILVYFIYYFKGLLLFEFNKKEEALKYFDISLSYKVTYEALINRGILLLEFN